MERIYWQRKRDGVLYSTVATNNSHDVLVRREIDGKEHWATWAGLNRKYYRHERES